MKNVVYSRQALLQLEDSVRQLVERGYFSDEDYAVDYVRDIFSYFALNLQNLLAQPAPDYFLRYAVDKKEMFYVKYRKSYHTTWYAFFEELNNVYSIVFLGNNHLIGHHLDISL